MNLGQSLKLFLKKRNFVAYCIDWKKNEVKIFEVTFSELIILSNFKGPD